MSARGAQAHRARSRQRAGRAAAARRVLRTRPRILWLCGLRAARELFDLALGGVEALPAEAVELLAALPELQRLVERRLARLEPVDDLLQLLLGLLEGHLVSSTRAPKPPSASSTSTRSPGSSE